MSDEELFNYSDSDSDKDIIEETKQKIDYVIKPSLTTATPSTSTSPPAKIIVLDKKNTKEQIYEAPKIHPYIFYEINEIVKFTPNIKDYSKKSEIFCVGVFEDVQPGLLIEEWGDRCSIPLEIGKLERVPRNKSLCEIYGNLKFSNDLPYIKVGFWRHSNCREILEYISLLHFQRKQADVNDLLI